MNAMQAMRQENSKFLTVVVKQRSCLHRDDDVQEVQDMLEPFR